MSDNADTTRWSLPGQQDVPRDQLRVHSWRSTTRRSCCGASRTAADGSGPSPPTGSPTPSPSTWDSPRGFCPRTPSGGTKARPDRWWDSGSRPGCGRLPFSGRRSSLPSGSCYQCPAWSSSARRGERRGSTPQRTGRPTRSSIYTRLRPSTSSATGGSVLEATASPKR